MTVAVQHSLNAVGAKAVRDATNIYSPCQENGDQFALPQIFSMSAKAVGSCCFNSARTNG